MSLHIIILAAGQGKRMHSTTPKVLHRIGGVPMLERVIETAQTLMPGHIHIVYGHHGAQVRDYFQHRELHWVHQAQQLGTGHAVLQVLPDLPRSGHVIILSADVPLIAPETLQRLQAIAGQQHRVTLLTAHVENPFGLGRIVRKKDGHIARIVEEKDADTAEKHINEIYSGICCVPVSDLHRWLPKMSSNNAQNEFYLTEIIGMACADGQAVEALCIEDPIQIYGVNDRIQLAFLERAYQQQQAESLMRTGTTLADPGRIDIRGTVTCAPDVFIDVNCVFEGEVHIASNAIIGAHCVIKDSTIGAGTHILPHSVLEGATIAADCQIGPFARLRPGTTLAAHCRIGNFVETKKATFGEHSKASHLAYLGDVSIGTDVNIGAGTITCNYDGVHKHQTIIEDGAFIGSDTQLVAPVTVGAQATLGAGTTLRKDAPAGALTLSVHEQKTIYGWQRPK